MKNTNSSTLYAWSGVSGDLRSDEWVEGLVNDVTPPEVSEGHRDSGDHPVDGIDDPEDVCDLEGDKIEERNTDDAWQLKHWVNECTVDQDGVGVPREVRTIVGEAGSSVRAERLELKRTVDQVTQLQHVDPDHVEHDHVDWECVEERERDHRVDSNESQPDVIGVEVVVQSVLDVLLILAVVCSHRNTKK